MRIPTRRLAGPVVALVCLVRAPALEAAAASPPAAAEVDARRAAAMHLHEQGRHVEAAELLERLLAETGRSDLRFDAGQARFAAGHRAHALRHWQAYAEAPGRSADDIVLATRRIADARAATTPVELRVQVAAGVAGLTATLRRRDAPPGRRPPPIVLQDMPSGAGSSGPVRTASVSLDPGAWELTVVAPGSPEARRELTIERAPQIVELSLLASPAPSPAPTRRARTGLSAGLLTTAAVTALPGGVLLGLRARRLDETAADCRTAGMAAPACDEQVILGHVRAAGLGSGLAGAGLGLAVAGITAVLPVRRRTWIAELATGGAAALAGAIWLATSTAAYAPTEFDAYLDRLQPWFRARAAATALLGAGLGLSVGATTGLLVWQRRAVTLQPALAPAGLGLVGRF